MFMVVSQRSLSVTKILTLISQTRDLVGGTARSQGELVQSAQPIYDVTLIVFHYETSQRVGGRNRTNTAF